MQAIHWGFPSGCHPGQAGRHGQSSGVSRASKESVKAGTLRCRRESVVGREMVQNQAESVVFVVAILAKLSLRRRACCRPSALINTRPQALAPPKPSVRAPFM